MDAKKVLEDARVHPFYLAGYEAGVADERKRCVEIAEHLNGWRSDCGRGGHAEHIARIIRGELIGNRRA